MLRYPEGAPPTSDMSAVSEQSRTVAPHRYSFPLQPRSSYANLIVDVACPSVHSAASSNTQHITRIAAKKLPLGKRVF